MGKKLSILLAVLLLLAGCKHVEKLAREHVDEIHVESVTATSVGDASSERNLERVVTVSVMEIDTTTGELRETQRTTTTEKVRETTSEKTENKAQNEAVETFSSESEVSYKETAEVVADETKTALRWQRRIIFIIIAAIVAVALFLWLKWKTRKTILP